MTVLVTPMSIDAPSRSRMRAIHFSCLGLLSPTQTMSGRAALIMSTAALSSSGVICRNGGQNVPATTSPGENRFLR